VQLPVNDWKQLFQCQFVAPLHANKSLVTSADAGVFIALAYCFVYVNKGCEYRPAPYRKAKFNPLLGFLTLWSSR
jgi:hypothetical protein